MLSIKPARPGLGAAQVARRAGRYRHPAVREASPRYEYFLTDKGKALGPVLKALYNWGERYG